MKFEYKTYRVLSIGSRPMGLNMSLFLLIVGFYFLQKEMTLITFLLTVISLTASLIAFVYFVSNGTASEIITKNGYCIDGHQVSYNDYHKKKNEIQNRKNKIKQFYENNNINLEVI